MTAPAKRPHQAASVEEAVDLLAVLDLAEYESYRKTVAEEWELRASVLDRMVAAKRKANTTNGADLDGWTVEPAPMPQDTAELLTMLNNLIRKYVIVSRDGATACALWIMFAWAHDAAEHSPILNIKSPTMRCGKTKLLTTVSWLAPRPQATMSITAATLYRFIEQAHPTLLVDEVDAFLAEKEELRGIINSGFDRGDQSALRMEESGGKFEVKRYGAWCPKVFAGIGNALPATVADRSITIELQRKKPSDKVSRLRRRDCGETFDTIKQMLARWAQDNMDALKAADPALPADLNDRAADAWEPLLAVADLAGGIWPQRARAVALALSGEALNGDAESLSVQLLADIRSIFADRDRLASDVIVGRLAMMDDRRWPEWKHGKPMTKVQLSRMLKPFNIVSRTIRLEDGSTPKGYYLAFFDDAFARYLPSETPQQHKPHETDTLGQFQNATPESCGVSENDGKARPNGHCVAVAVQNAESGGNDDDGGLDRLPEPVVADDEGDGWEAAP